MNKSDFKILVVGAGAIGGITAAFLKKNGLNVEIVCKYDDYASVVSDTGIEVSGVCGKFTVKMSACATISQVRKKKILFFLLPRQPI